MTNNMKYFTANPPNTNASPPSTNPSLTLAYQTHGNPKHPAILIPTCFSGLVPSTLSFLYTGPNAPLANYFVIVVGLLGGSDSSSPSNAHPSLCGANFPPVTYETNITLQYALCQALGITSLSAYIGFSMGGQQAYYMAVMYPDFATNIIVLASCARTSWHCKSFLEGPKTALVNSIDWCGGLYEQPAKLGTQAFARAYSTWALSSRWFRHEFWKRMGCETVEEYLTLFWDEKMGALDARDLMCMVKTWVAGDVSLVGEEGNGDLARVLGGIKAKVLLMPCRTDLYFPPEDSEEELRELKFGKMAVIESVWGHLAGGEFGPVEDQEFIGAEIRDFLLS